MRNIVLACAMAIVLALGGCGQGGTDDAAGGGGPTLPEITASATGAGSSHARTIIPENAPTPRYFNDYILAAVEKIAAERGNQGYANSAFTRDLSLVGRGTVPAGRSAPMTMCVAAQLEVIIEALNIYAEEHPDLTAARAERVHSYLPLAAWTSLRPMQLRGQLWLVKETVDLAEELNAPDIRSRGAADALAHFGMGEVIAFNQLQPGDMLNLNRVSGGGHGVIFMGHIDARGEPLAHFSDAVAGFRYFSAQGEPTDGGFGFRRAFFSIDREGNCPESAPARGVGERRDCGVIRSTSQRLLHTGRMLHPEHWSAAQRDAWTARMGELRQDPNRSPRGRAALDREGTFDEAFFTGRTTDD
jgi:hypothetical protein